MTWGGLFRPCFCPPRAGSLLRLIAMQIVSVKSQSALSGVQQNLREGDFVFVRALKDLGGGKYAVSFAGGRFDVMSERALREGQTFRAQVSFAGGKVLLTPVQTGAQGGAAFLQSLGFAADGIAQRIMQFLTQSGSRLDPGLMQKVRRLAQKFKGREAEAAESALVLEEKGIDSESPALEKLVDLLGGGGTSGQEKDFGQGQEGSQAKDGGGQDGSKDGDTSQSGEGSQAQEAPAVVEIAAELRRWFESLLAGAAADFGQDKNSGQGQEGSQAQEAGADFLALFNQLPSLASSAEKKGWLVFPFEIERPGNGGLFYGGDLRLYLDYENKIAEKALVAFKSSGANIYFAVYFNGRKEPRAVKAWASQEALQKLLAEELPSLKAAFGADVKVEALPPGERSAFGVEDLPLMGVEAFA